MDAADVMTVNVATVRPDASVQKAAQTMLAHGVSGLPVVDAAQRLVGIVTEGDFLRRAEIGTSRRRPRWLEFLVGPGKLASEYVQTHSRKVEDIMTPEVETVREDTSLQAIVDLMERRRIKRVPVVAGEKVVGIISRANLVQALARLAEEAQQSAPDDATLRRRILAELDKQPWAPPDCINVIVRNGIAEVWGTILDERKRAAIRVAVENVPGVQEVKDHLVWVAPDSGLLLGPL